MISVILSTNNEIRSNILETLLTRIQDTDRNYEIIVVDNESQDATREICSHYTSHIYNLPNSNRAQRYNYGLYKARGDIIVFHHPATLLPDHALSDIQDTIQQGSVWGCFSHSFDRAHPLLTFTSWYSNHVRADKKGIVYADHIIFGTKKVFESIGGFPDMDIFEETPFSLKLKHAYGFPKRLSGLAKTSARRFMSRGVWRHALLNQYLKVCYHLGISHRSMNHAYENKEGYNVNY